MIANERTLDVETWAEAWYLARLDYELNLGRSLTVDGVVAYVGDDGQDYFGPFLVRLEKTDAESLRHSVDEYLDPYWDVTVLDDFDADGAWSYGPSYRVLESARKRIQAAS